MPTYKIPCTWTMSGHYDIEAATKEEAVAEAHARELPDDAAYLEDSFVIYDEEIEEGP